MALEPFENISRLLLSAKSNVRFFTKGLLAKLLQIEQRPLMVNDKLCKDRAFFFVAHKRGQKKY